MKVAVLGAGGREHALVWRIGRDGHTVACLPGSDGIPGSVPVDLADPMAVTAALRAFSAELVVIGPEAPLQAGLADDLRAAGFAVVGPGRAGAQLEASKGFAKQFMVRHGVATAQYVAVRGADQACEALDGFAAGVVVKYDGLAAGKGVVVCDDRAQAAAAIADLCALHGADAPLVLEQRLRGREVSVLALVDGAHALLLPPAMDHKRLLDDDAGPNTGGMGAVCPVPWCTPARLADIERAIVRPTLAGLAADGIAYRGVLYFGVMVTAAGPKLLEYNARFGDPETQAVLPMVAGDFTALLAATAAGELAGRSVTAASGAAVAVVLAAAGYPGTPRKGDALFGLDGVAAPVFHAGTRRSANGWLSNGGRLLAVLGQGDDVGAARAAAYGELDKVLLAGGQARTDIGHKALPLRAAVLFSGRGSNLGALAAATQPNGPLRGLATLALALSNRPDAAGIAVAQSHGIPIAVLPSKGLDREAHDAQVVDALRAADIELVLLAGYMRVLSPVFVRAFAGRIFNIHPADTRAHQGLHGYDWAWQQRLAQTWVTVHLVDEGLDTGPIVAQAPVDLAGCTSLSDVEARGLAVEHTLYAQAVAGWLLENP
ncbi:MAG: phosphoribosylamine--glycine ligase [Deltaproteobacteria bacterium]|nr:phosphoribosylamine--glycine ligase [Deltaproteobacteria bacterium]